MNINGFPSSFKNLAQVRNVIKTVKRIFVNNKNYYSIICHRLS